MTRRGRGRRPAAEVRAEVLTAAGELLLGEGMGAFTMERVAARSGASKMTLYKWWPSKGALALDGYFHAVEQTLEFPDTGDVEVDLRRQLARFIDLVTTTSAGRVIAELIGLAQTDADLAAAFHERYERPRRELACEVVHAGQRRGQLRSDIDPETIIDQLWGACYHRLLVPAQPLTQEFGTALIDNLLRGLRPQERTTA